MNENKEDQGVESWPSPYEQATQVNERKRNMNINSDQVQSVINAIATLFKPALKAVAEEEWSERLPAIVEEVKSEMEENVSNMIDTAIKEMDLNYREIAEKVVDSGTFTSAVDDAVDANLEKSVIEDAVEAYLINSGALDKAVDEQVERLERQVQNMVEKRAEEVTRSLLEEHKAWFNEAVQGVHNHLNECIKGQVREQLNELVPSLSIVLD